MFRLPPLSGLAVTNLAVQGISALTGVLLARLLGPEGRGELAIVLLLPGIMAHVGLLGIHLTLARRSALLPERLWSLHRLGQRASVFLGILSFTVTVATLPLLLPANKTHLHLIAQFVAISIPASMWNVVQMHIELGAQKFGNYNMCRLWFSPIYVVLCITAWWVNGATVTSIALAYVLATILGALIPYLFIAGGITRRHEDSSLVKSGGGLLRQSFPFAAVIGIQAVANRVDLVWLTRLVDAQAIGIYVVAIAASTLHVGIGQALGTLLFARTASFTTSVSNKEWIALRSRQAIVLQVTMCSLMIAILPPLLPLIFGVAYSEAARLLPGLIVASGFTALAELFEEILKGRGVARMIVIARVSTMTVLSLVAFAIIGLHGLSGMVLALLCGAVTHLAIAFGAVQREFGLSARNLLMIRRSDIQEMVNFVRTTIRQSRLS